MLTFLQWFKFKTSCEATDFDPFYSKTNLKCNFFGQNTISVLLKPHAANTRQFNHLEKLDSFHPSQSQVFPCFSSQAQSQLAVATSLYDSDILMAAVLGAAGWESHLAMESPHTKITHFIYFHIIYIIIIYNVLYIHYITYTHTHYI